MMIIVGLALPGIGQPAPPGEPPMPVDDQDSDSPRSWWLATREDGRSRGLHLPYARSSESPL
jgi:hypothetical protein